MIDIKFVDINASLATIEAATWVSIQCGSGTI